MKITAGRSDRFVPETHTPLWISARKLEALLKTAPTPLFVYDEKSLVRAVQALFAAFSWEPGFLPRFPVRMNPDPAVLRILRGAGCGAICRDGRELRLAAACGFAGPAVAYAPMRADAAAEQLARELGAVFVLDGPQVLPAFAPEAAVLLLRQQGPLRISGRPVMGAPVSSAGMEEAELCRLAACLHAGGTRTLGLGMSLGDLCMDEGFYPAVFAQLAETVVRLREKTGLTAKIFDLGGGFGVSCRPDCPGPDLSACAEALRAQTCALPEALQGVQLSMSPGRFLAAGGGVLVCRVVAVKPGPVAVLDVSAAQCLRLEKRGAYHTAAALRTAGRPPLLQQLTTLEQGAPFARQVLPQLRVGDPVIIRMLGADGRSFSCASERCPAYLLRADGTIEPIE